MAEISFDKPAEAVGFPSPLIDPRKKDKNYDLQCAKAIWYNNWNTYNNPYGNQMRTTWLDTRAYARGTAGVSPFAQRPPAKNDHTKNPLLRHIDFSPVNEMVKFCDIYVSKLEENDYDIVATAINPAAAASKNEMRAKAMAYRENKAFYDNVNQMAGQDVAPKNPLEFDFETQREIDIFFDLGVKLKEEISAELATEVVLNDSDWARIRKLICEDVRDTGYMVVKRVVDSNCKLRFEYVDVVNAGWEDYRGHYLTQPSRFWNIVVKTGAQLAAESGGQFSQEEIMDIARAANGKYGNPFMPSLVSATTNFGYVNSDNPYQTAFFDNWKFPVLECMWEDWDVSKYRSIKRTEDNEMESYSPVDFGYEPKKKVYNDRKTGKEKRIDIHETPIHHYRECKWVIGTDACYDAGRTKYCPRNPRDVRYSLSPVKVYRASSNPFAQRIKPIAKMAQNAWYKFQNEVAKARPSGVSINLAAMDNLTTLDGMKLTRRHILELFNEDGLQLYSDKAAMDSQGVTRRLGEPIRPIQNVDAAAMQRWIDVINYCSVRMAQEGGLVEFTNNNDQYTPAVAVKAAISSSDNSLKQYVDALSKISEEIAIDSIGTIQALVLGGDYYGYVSSIGNELLKPVVISKNITDFTFGIKIQAKPTAIQRQELKIEIRKQFSSLGDPTQGSLYAPDLLYLEQLIDGGTNLKIVALIASYFHKRNMKQMQEAKMQDIQANAESQKGISATASQIKMQEEQQLSAIRMQEDDHKTDNLIRLKQAESQFRTENQVVTAQQKSENKKSESVLEKTLEV